MIMLNTATFWDVLRLFRTFWDRKRHMKRPLHNQNTEQDAKHKQSKSIGGIDKIAQRTSLCSFCLK
jgi:hypothetical protein